MNSADGTARPETLNCQSCAAPLILHGGHQVRSLTCGYCGAVMDAHDKFKVVKQYTDLVRPRTPFEIGMTGTIKGVEFTVIGTVQYGYQDQWGSYDWVSSQLFSPTHGYAWITFNDGHLVFSRRIRELPSPALPTGTTPKSSITRVRGEKFRFYEAFRARIQFVEGELTWLAAIHDSVEVSEYIAPPLAFEYERSSGELEYSLSEYLQPDEVKQSFGIERLPNAVGIHPAQPFVPGAVAKAVADSSYYFMIIAAIGLIFTAVLGGGRQVADIPITFQPGSQSEVPFAFTKPEHLLYVKIDTNVDNNWTYVEAEIVDENDEPVALVGREISHYSGVEGGEHWSEGSRSTKATVRLPAAGNYRLLLEVDPQARVTAVGRIGIWEGYMPWRYFTILTATFLLAALSLWIRRWFFEKRRWAEVIEDDDD